jgi:hypothetical protein
VIRPEADEAFDCRSYGSGLAANVRSPDLAYLVDLPITEQERLDPKFEGGTVLQFDMIAPEGYPLREMDLGTCIQLHLRVPPELLGSVPTRVAVRVRKGKNLPDFGLAPWGGWGLVSEAFVNIIEKLEPETHQFLQIADTVDRKGHKLEKRYFLMNILQQINAVDTERSSVKINEHQARIPASDGTKRNFTFRTMAFLQPYTLVLTRALIAGHHLWHGTNKDLYRVFFSQELYEAVRADNLSPLEYLHADES